MDNEFILQDRLQKIRQIVNKYGQENFCLSFSGGKDSTVMHYLVDEAIPNNKIPRVYFNTGIEFKKVVEFVKELASKDDRFVIVSPSVNIREMLESEGYPFKSKEHSKYLEEFRLHDYKHTNTTYNYANRIGKYNSKYGCPKRLLHQFTPDYNFKISAKCCDKLKKEPAKQWMDENNKTWTMTGIRKEEGGLRRYSDCVVENRAGGGQV